MYVCVYISLYIYIYICMHVCMYVCVYVCMYVCIYIYIYCVYVCVCTYIYIYIYIYIYTHRVYDRFPNIQTRDMEPDPGALDGQRQMDFTYHLLFPPTGSVVGFQSPKNGAEEFSNVDQTQRCELDHPGAQRYVTTPNTD